MNNLYEKIDSNQNEINYQDLYGRDDKRGNPERIFNSRFSEGINLLRMPVQALLENETNVNYKDYDSNKNYYKRYQNNVLDGSPMKNDICSSVGNFASFKSDPNSNAYINSLMNNSKEQCRGNSCIKNNQIQSQQQYQPQQSLQYQQPQYQQQQQQSQYQQQQSQYQQQQSQYQQQQSQYQQQQQSQYQQQQQQSQYQQSFRCENCINK